MPYIARMRPSRAILVLLTPLLFAGCVVSKTKYRAALDDVRRCKAARADEVKRLKAKIAALEAQISAINQRLESSKQRARVEQQATQAELDELRKQRAETEAQLAEFKKLTSKFRKMIDAGKLKVYIRRGRMMVALPSSVLFPSGKAELSERGKTALATVAETLKEFPNRRFLVAGHTDNVRIKGGDFADNWQLSTARALTVTRYLIEQGLKPKNLAAAGYSKFDPVRSNRTRRGRRRNRRIELILVPNIAPLPKLPQM